MKFLQKAIQTEEVKKNAHYKLSMHEDKNGVFIFKLDDKDNNHIATINKYGSMVTIICSGKQTEKMAKAFEGMPKKYKITINGNKI